MTKPMNESADPKFFVAAEKFKALWPAMNSYASNGVGSQQAAAHCAATPAVLVAEDRLIYAPDAPLPIGALTPVRDAVGDNIA